MEPDHLLCVTRKPLDGDRGTQNDQDLADGVRDETRPHPGRRSNT
jgi:hypothetical protein